MLARFRACQLTHTYMHANAACQAPSHLWPTPTLMPVRCAGARAARTRAPRPRHLVAHALHPYVHALLDSRA
jgi:hypothetical protein